MKHNANFKYDLQWGKQGETVVAEIQQGEKTEVKSERDKWIKTGNHYCEYQSRGKESGIKKTQAEQLGSIDKLHPMKQITAMAVIQFLMLAGMAVAMLFIGLNV